jgi:hypothetical protein
VKIVVSDRYGKGKIGKAYLTSPRSNTGSRATVNCLTVFPHADKGVETEAANRSEEVNRAEGGIGQNEDLKRLTERAGKSP